MVTQVLPKSADNGYRGHVLAPWLLGLLVLMKASIGVNSILNGYTVATTADGLPLDTYPPPAARTVVALFGTWGVGQLAICLVAVVVLVRYRSLVPSMFALFLLEHLSRKLVLQFLPIPRTGTPPGTIVNVVLLVVVIGGLALSLWRRDGVRVRASPTAGR